MTIFYPNPSNIINETIIWYSSFCCTYTQRKSCNSLLFLKVPNYQNYKCYEFTPSEHSWNLTNCSRFELFKTLILPPFQKNIPKIGLKIQFNRYLWMSLFDPHIYIYSTRPGSTFCPLFFFWQKKICDREKSAFINKTQQIWNILHKTPLIENKELKNTCF